MREEGDRLSSFVFCRKLKFPVHLFSNEFLWSPLVSRC
jgi:hypothetical protein